MGLLEKKCCLITGAAQGIGAALGLEALCIGGGQGLVAVLEAVA